MIPPPVRLFDRRAEDPVLGDSVAWRWPLEFVDSGSAFPRPLLLEADEIRSAADRGGSASARDRLRPLGVLAALAIHAGVALIVGWRPPQSTSSVEAIDVTFVSDDAIAGDRAPASDRQAEKAAEPQPGEASAPDPTSPAAAPPSVPVSSPPAEEPSPAIAPPTVEEAPPSPEAPYPAAEEAVSRCRPDGAARSAGRVGSARPAASSRIVLAADRTDAARGAGPAAGARPATIGRRRTAAHDRADCAAARGRDPFAGRDCGCRRAVTRRPADAPTRRSRDVARARLVTIGRRRTGARGRADAAAAGRPAGAAARAAALAGAARAARG